MSTSIGVISVPVADQDRARKFYVDTLGWSVVADEPSEEGRWVQLALPGGGATVALVTWIPTMPAGSLKGTVLFTPDVDGTYEVLSDRGMRFAGPVQDAYWGRFAEFDDCEGNGWILMQAPEGAT